MAMYFDFETTAPTDSCSDPEQKKMFVISCFNCCFSSSPKL